MQGHSQIETSLLRDRIEVFLHGGKIADTIHALRVEEPGSDPVIYIPKSDLKDVTLVSSGKVLECPKKGQAQYFALKAGALKIDEAAWAYEVPREEVAELKHHVAFAAHLVDIIRVHS